MTQEEIERIDTEALDAWASRDADAFAAYLADTFVWTDSAVPEPMRSKDAAKEYAQTWFTALPDFTVKQTHRIVSGDTVAAEIEFRGTNTGTMSMGGKDIPATGKPVVGRAAYFSTIRDGKIVEFSTHPDLAGMMMQLGLLGE